MPNLNKLSWLRLIKKRIIMELRHYEVAILLAAHLGETGAKQQLEEYMQVFKQAQAQVLSQSAPLAQKLAYPIQRQTQALYVFIEFAGPPTIIPKLEKLAKHNENILRIFIHHLDKHAIAYNQKKQQIK